MDSADVDLEDLILLEGDGLRVNPQSGVVHRATCRTQLPEWRPVVAPWPKYAADTDRPCRSCRPDLRDAEAPEKFGRAEEKTHGVGGIPAEQCLSAVFGPRGGLRGC